MILHNIVRYIIKNNGPSILFDQRLYNYIQDIQGFQYEQEGVRGAMRLFLKDYSRKIQKDLFTDSSKYIIVNKYIDDFKRNYGIENEIAQYVVESIAFGLKWIDNITPTRISNRITHISQIEFWHYLSLWYHFLGINITSIVGSSNDAWANYYDDEYFYFRDRPNDSFKHPINSDWEMYVNEPQTIDYINKIDFSRLTGLGAICGYNNLRVIDIDNITSLGSYDGTDKTNKFINKILEILKLPKDYKWVVKSGSGKGLHIYIRCEPKVPIDLKRIAFTDKTNLEDLDFDLGSYSRYHKGEKQQAFEKLELIWEGHVVLPYSHGRWDISDNIEGSYTFINGAPVAEPQFVDLDSINTLLNAVSGGCSFGFSWKKFPNGQYCNLLKMIKSENTRDSMGGYYHFEESLEWLQNMTSAEGLNSLASKYVELGDYEKAISIFQDNLSFPPCRYNLVLLQLNGAMPIDQGFIQKSFTILKSSPLIGEYELDSLSRLIEKTT